MSYTVSLQQRIQQLKKAQANLPEVLSRVQTKAAEAAVAAAQDATPPKAGTGRGPYIGECTISDQLKGHWKTDSRIEPEIVGNKVQSVLANNLPYASYVNDGHRMDRHFVPGLYIDKESGLLSYDPAAKVGLVVGTKTKYVKGEFMVDKARRAYENTCLDLLDDEIRRLLE